MLNSIKHKIKTKSKTDVNMSTQDNGKVFFLNPYTYLLLRKRKDLIDAADHIYVDGQLLCNFLKWFKVIETERVSFDNSSLAPQIFLNAQHSGRNIAVIGSTTDVAKKFKSYLKETYPELNIRISRGGYFSSNNEVHTCCKNIKSNQVDIVVVGMGAIHQEEFLIELFDSGWNGAAYTCGGFMHQTASKGHRYYPIWIDKLNLRYMYRIWDEPKLIKRYTVDYTKFLVMFFYDYIKYRNIDMHKKVDSLDKI